MASNYYFFINSINDIWSIAAIGQKNLKRLMAYSSISHMGFALAGLAVGTNEGIQKLDYVYVIYTYS